MTVYDIPPATVGVEQTTDGRQFINLGPLPMDLQAGDILQFQLSPENAYRLGLLLTDAAIGRSAECALIEDDIDDVESPVPRP